jgi:hypothetical protein
MFLKLKFAPGVLALSLLILAPTAVSAAARLVTASGTFSGATGSLSYLAGDGFTVEYIFNANPAEASVEQHDDPSPEPNLDRFDAWGFDGAPYSATVFTAEIAGGQLSLAGVDVKRYDNDSGTSNAVFTSLGVSPPDPGTDPNILDILEYHSANTISLSPDPNSPLLGDPADGVEIGLNAIMLGNWIETSAPNTLDLPPSNEVYAYFFSATEYDAAGAEIGSAYAVLPIGSVSSSGLPAVPSMSPPALVVLAFGLIFVLRPGRRAQAR